MTNYSPTPFVIRTITITCKTSHKLNYDKVCEQLPITNRIINIEYKKHKNGKIHIRGNKPNPSKNLFYNQLTVEVLLGDNKKINCKLFTNGVIHMTGCRSKYDAYNASGIIVNAIEKIIGYCNQQPTDIVSIFDYSIRMINSNFNIGEPNTIDRYELYDILNKDFKYFFSYFNPDKYPGVKIYFKYYNNPSMYNWKPIDVCNWLQSNKLDICIPVLFNNNISGTKLINLSHNDLINMGIDDSLIRDKLYKAINNKKLIKNVTIIVFRTGQIIITGAQNYDQLTSAYDFINNVISDHYDDIIIQT